MEPQPNPTNPTPPNPDPNNPRISQAVRQRVGVGTLADTLSVLRMDRQNALTRRLVRKHQDGTLGKADTMPEEDETNVNIGDQYHYNTRPEVPTIIKTGISPAWAIGPSLAALGLAGALLYPRLTDNSEPPTVPPKEEPAVIAGPNEDTDTKYGIRFVEPLNP